MKKSAGRRMRRRMHRELMQAFSKMKQKLNDNKYGKVPKNA